MSLSVKTRNITGVFLFTIIIETIFSNPAAWSQDENGLTPPIQISGQILQIKAIGELLVIRANKLYLVDISNPEVPLVIGALDVGATWEIAVWDQHVFAITVQNELVVVDVSDPKNPETEAVLSIPGDAVGIDIERDLAYLACRDSKLILVDVHDLSSMEILSISETPEAALWIDEFGGVVHLAGRFGVWTYNVSSLENPILNDEIMLNDLVGGQRGIIAREDNIYVLMRGYIAVLGKYASAGLRLIFSEDGASVFTRFGFDFKGEIACVANEHGGATLLDYTSPDSPLRIGHVDLNGCAGGVRFVGDYIFIGDRLGLNVIDISNPAGPYKAAILMKEVNTDEIVLAKLLKVGLSTYPEVRKVVMGLGWEPLALPETNDLYEPLKSYLVRGWIECQNCSGSGLGICDFEFQKPGCKKRLHVCTAGILERGDDIPILYRWYFVE